MKTHHSMKHDWVLLRYGVQDVKPQVELQFGEWKSEKGRMEIEGSSMRHG
jgi:hypothetical protein